MEYAENMERAAFYARSVLETVKKLRWAPNVIHCQGWISAFIPVYIKTAYADEPWFKDCRVVFSPMGNGLTVSNSKEKFANILYYKNAGSDNIKEFNDTMTPDDLLKVGIKFADGVTLQSPLPSDEVVAYARKLKKPILENADGEPAKYNEFIDQIWSLNRQEKAED